MPRMTLDPDHSVATFVIRHMMINSVHGQFNKISGFLEFDPADYQHAYAEAEIDVAGIYTGIQKRDDHLRSADFFEVEKYPKMTFKSRGIELTGFNNYLVSGDLTIRGTTRPVVFDVEYYGPVKSPYDDKARTYGFSASTKINREDFNITWNVPMEFGFVVGKHVEIILNLEADYSLP